MSLRVYISLCHTLTRLGSCLVHERELCTISLTVQDTENLHFDLAKQGVSPPREPTIVLYCLLKGSALPALQPGKVVLYLIPLALTPGKDEDLRSHPSK